MMAKISFSKAKYVLVIFQSPIILPLLEIDGTLLRSFAFFFKPVSEFGEIEQLSTFFIAEFLFFQTVVSDLTIMWIYS